MREFAKIDANQNEIVKALRKVGATVQSLSSIGHGCPDLLVGFRGVNYLFEVKDGTKSPSRIRLTDDEEKWAIRWAGRWDVVVSVYQALSAIGAMQ